MRVLLSQWALRSTSVSLSLSSELMVMMLRGLWECDWSSRGLGVSSMTMACLLRPDFFTAPTPSTATLLCVNLLPLAPVLRSATCGGLFSFTRFLTGECWLTTASFSHLQWTTLAQLYLENQLTFIQWISFHNFIVNNRHYLVKKGRNNKCFSKNKCLSQI